MEFINYFYEMWGLVKNGRAQGYYFYGALYFFLTLSYSIIYQIKVRSWPSVSGKKLKIKVENFSMSTNSRSDQKYALSGKYEYTVNGVNYIGNKISPWLIVASGGFRSLLLKQENKIGANDQDLVKVYYNPKNPQKSYLILPGIIGIFFTTFMAATPFVLYWIKY